MPLYERVADLEFTVEEYALSTQERATSSGFDRTTTTVTLRGDGVAGRGEDVTYEAEEHEKLLEADDFPLAGTYTHREFSSLLDGVDLFPAGPPEKPVRRNYRQWAFESAALDLALKQADTTLAAALDRTYDPVRFVVSTRLGDPPSADRVERWLDVDSTLEFKLDATSDWDDALVSRLAATDAVRILDLKGQYEGSEVDQAADPVLYRRVLDAFPDAVVEDPALTTETRSLFEGREGRVSWDAPITGVESLQSLPFPPRWLNVKPSRFGSVASLFACIEHCLDAGVALYGGGQFELDVGRQHVQALASLFYPDGPNDVAPRAYNDPEPTSEVPSSPLAPPDSPRGFEWRR